MSHLTTLKSELNDLSAVADAAKDLGAVWTAGRGSKVVGRGWGSATFEADHLITIPGCKYDVGVFVGEGGMLSFSSDLYTGEVEASLGKGLLQLKRHAAAHVATKAMRKAHRGKRVRRKVLTDGTIRLQVG